MCYHGRQLDHTNAGYYTESSMLLKALVVRSTTQKDESLSVFAESKKASMGLARSEMGYYRLHGTDKMIIVAIEGIVAHGSGGNQGKLLVL